MSPAIPRDFTLIVDGVPYTIHAEGTTVTINGRTYTVEVGNGHTVFVDGIAYRVEWQGDQAIVDGRPFSIRTTGLASVPAPPPTRVTPPKKPTAHSIAQGAVFAVMPGKIVRVLVKPGQRVEIGEPVCVLEAMKMENELRAPQAGTVKRVYVAPGDDVSKDQVLIEIE